MVGSVWRHLQTRSKISLWTEFPTSEIPGLLTFLCCSNVHLHIQCGHPVRLCLWWGQQHLQLLFGGRARSMERDLAETVGQWLVRMGQMPAAHGERKHSDCSQKAVRCWLVLEMRGDWWKKQWRSSQSQGHMLKAPGRSGLGWLSIRKREQPTMDRAWRPKRLGVSF